MASGNRLVIFDADCGICQALASWLERVDRRGALELMGNDLTERFPRGVDRALTEKTLVVVDADGRIFQEERAVFEVGRALGWGLLGVFWLRVPGLSFIGRGLYRAVARRRHRLSALFGMQACGASSGDAWGDTRSESPRGPLVPSPSRRRP